MASNFSIGGLDVDLIVGDVDKVNLIDFVIDYQDESQKKNIFVPMYPCFYYVHNSSHHELLNEDVGQFTKL